MVVAVEVPETANAGQIAQQLRESRAAEKIQRSLVHAVIPTVLDEEVEITVVDDEHFTHLCEWYDVDECPQCRRASSYALGYTQKTLYGDH